MEANRNKHLAATVTIAEKDKNGAIDEDLERRRTLPGDIVAATGTVTRTVKEDVIEIGTEVATAKEDLDVLRKKERAVGVHGTVALAMTTPSATAAP